jgi:ATP-dependent RNA helicase DeaD
VTQATPELLGPELFAAFEAKGYETLTAVQTAVLSADRLTRDLRITSQTGSGKTIAIGLALSAALSIPKAPAEGAKDPKKKSARPRALVITPTRELGRQVEEELTWLFSKLKMKVTAVTGGASYQLEHRALMRNPEVIVATPGRLIDHLDQGVIDPSEVEVVVLDEADRMLDMGFSESLETILSKVPKTRRTHLVSATFPSDVRHLADRIQSAPLHLEGTRLGAANVDIKHVLYLVDPQERLDALINLLLAHSESRTLVFSKTRAGVNELEGALNDAGFRVAGISGEMAQRERTRALEGFKRGVIRVLVATDVAARGIDVSDVSLVLNMEVPTNADDYTHRSGRTGRAGKKGTSAVLVAPRELRRAHAILARANVAFRLLPMPTPASIRQAQDARLVDRLTLDEPDVTLDEHAAERTGELAARLLEAVSSKDADPLAMQKMVARLLGESGLTQGPEPRDVRVILPEPERARGRGPNGFDAPPQRGRFERDERPRFEKPRFEREDRAPITELPPATHLSQAAPSFPRAPRAPRFESAPFEAAPFENVEARPPRAPRGEPRQDQAEGGYETFQVSWGGQHGADARRLLAILCRRGDITSNEIGAIRVGPTSSTVAVRSEAAAHFLANAQKPDPRDPRVRVRALPNHWDEERQENDVQEAERALPPDRATKPRRPPASHAAPGGNAPPRRR